MPDADGYDLISELSPDGARQREVYARFGLTAFKAQVFDHDLVNLLSMARSVDQPMARDQLDATFAALFTKTSGSLVNTAAKESRLGVEDLDICQRAVDERNRLIHHFFRHHAENFMTSAGQQRMLDDLAGIARLLDEAGAACRRVFLEVGKAKGLTQKAIEREYQEALSRIGTDTE